MARKSLEEFRDEYGDIDYQAYADYLDSPQCTQDEGWDVIGDQFGNVYTPTEGDWTIGHGHKNENTGYDRPADSKDSYGRKWTNRWLKYCAQFGLTQEEAKVLGYYFDLQEVSNVIENSNTKKLCK
jgi:hypothetical protein